MPDKITEWLRVMAGAFSGSDDNFLQKKSGLYKKVLI